MRIKQVLLAVLTIILITTNSTIIVFAANVGQNEDIKEYIENMGGSIHASIEKEFRVTNDINDVKSNYGENYVYYTYRFENQTTYYVLDRLKEDAVVEKINNIKSADEVTTDINNNVLGQFAVEANTKNSW